MVCFSFVDAHHGRSERQHNLAISQIKSHAAKATHAKRRKTARKLPQECCPHGVLPSFGNSQLQCPGCLLESSYGTIDQQFHHSDQSETNRRLPLSTLQSRTLLDYDGDQEMLTEANISTSHGSSVLQQTDVVISRTTTWVLRGITPVTSEYLHETYWGSYRDKINGSVDYCAYYPPRNVEVQRLTCAVMNVAGPIFIWRLMSTEHERLATRDSMVRYFLHEPAFTEALLAWIDCLRNKDASAEVEPPHASLFHQQKSLSLLRHELSEPKSVCDSSILWTVVANMVLNQECGDWKSFDVNMQGLQSIIALSGGRQALMDRNPRAFFFTDWLMKIRSTVADEHFQPLPTGTNPALNATSKALDRKSEELIHEQPQLMLTPDRAGTLSPGCILQIHAGIALLEKCYSWRISSVEEQQHDEESLQVEKLQAEVAFREVVFGNISLADFVICVGMVIRLRTTPPVEDSARHVLPPAAVTELFDKLWGMAETISRHCRQDHVLWTCLVFMEMPMNLAPGLSHRLALLKALVPSKSLCSGWREIRGSLAEIYLDAEMERIWGTCWENIIRPAFKQ